MNVFLIGAGGHSKVVMEIVEKNNFKIGGFIDNYSEKLPDLEYNVFRSIESSGIQDKDYVIISIGDNRIRKQVSLTFNYPYLSVLHPDSSVSGRTKFGKGTVVMSGATVNPNVIIGDHVIINTNSSVDHDSILGNFVHISPNAALAGNVVVGEGTHIGIGATLIQGVKIGSWCTIGAGAVIIKDVPDGCTVVGNPGRIIKRTIP